MGKLLDSVQYGQVIAGLTIAGQIARGEESTLTDDWTISDGELCNFNNEWQVTNLVPLVHPDKDDLRQTIDAAHHLWVSGNLPPTLNLWSFLYALKPQPVH